MNRSQNQIRHITYEVEQFFASSLESVLNIEIPGVLAKLSPEQKGAIEAPSASFPRALVEEIRDGGVRFRSGVGAMEITRSSCRQSACDSASPSGSTFASLEDKVFAVTVVIGEWLIGHDGGRWSYGPVDSRLPDGSIYSHASADRFTKRFCLGIVSLDGQTFLPLLAQSEVIVFQGPFDRSRHLSPAGPPPAEVQLGSIGASEKDALRESRNNSNAGIDGKDFFQLDITEVLAIMAVE